MGKLIVLKLEGDLKQQGFKVTLEIGNEENSSTAERFATRPWIEISGRLPANPELANTVRHHWLETYRSVGAPVRIKSKKITYDGFINERIQVCRESADVLRDRTTDWLDADSFKPIDRRLREELDRQQPARFLIRSDDPQLQKLPWHLWDLVERYPKAEVAFSSVVSNPPQPPQSENRNPKVRILAILGHSAEIDIEADRKLLENLPDTETVFLVEPKHQQLNDQLWEQPWDIIFFAGHSETQEDSGRIYINPNECLTVSELWYALRKAVDQGLKLAIFNSCDGLGLTRALDDLNIPQMIVMRELIPDQVAQEFLKYFLEAFSGGQPFYLSVRAARERLQGLESQYPCASWLPVICQNPAAMPLNWDDLRGVPKSGTSTDEAEAAQSVQVPVPVAKQRPKFKLAFDIKVRTVLAASLAMTSLVTWGRWQGHLQPFEMNAFDRLMQNRPLEPRDKRILIIRVTPEDIVRISQPPEETGQGSRSLSDRTLDRLIEKLEQYQPRAIGLSLFREGDVDPVYGNLKRSLQEGILFGMCVPGGRAFDFMERQEVEAPSDLPPERIGFADSVVDRDGAIRRHLLFMTVDNRVCKKRSMEALSLQLALSYLEEKGIFRSDSPDDDFLKIGNTIFSPLKLHRGGYHRSNVEGGVQVMLNYRPYRDYRKDIAPTVSLTSALNGHLTAGEVKDRIVLIGVDSIDDRYRTPYTKGHDYDPSQKLPGVFMHAQMVSHILSVVEGERPLIWTWAWWGDSLWIFGWSLIGGVIACSIGWSKGRDWKSLLSFCLASGISTGALYALCLGFLIQGGWIPLVPAVIALLMTGGSIVVYTKLQEQQQNQS